jgi:hypothetical protein
MAFGFLKKALKGVGKLAQKAAPVIGLVPGVGTLAAAGIGGAGGLLSGGGFEGMLKGAAGGAAGGLLGHTGIGGRIGQFAKNAFTGGDGFQMGDLGRIAQFALPAMGAYQSYQASKQAGKDSQRARELHEQAMGITGEEYERAKGAWQANQGLRDQFRQIAMNFGDPTNPFTRAMTMAGGGAAPEASGAAVNNPALLDQQSGGMAGKIAGTAARMFKPGGQLAQYMESQKGKSKRDFGRDE